MATHRTIRALVAGAALAAAAFAGGPAAAQGRSFKGFNDSFNLGRSANSGAVCQAVRSFDDPVLGPGRRAWDITCRGWTQKLGSIYVFDGSTPAADVAAWRSALQARSDCDLAKAAPAPGLEGGRAVACKTQPGGLDYVVLTDAGKGRAIGAEGMAAIADVLTTGVRFAAGDIDEPAAIAEQTASVAQVTSAQVSALTLAGETRALSLDARRQEAYRRNQQWRFEDAEALFGELAAVGGDGSNPSASRAEALYNYALNVSNSGRFLEAELSFLQADEAAAAAGPDPVLAALALNYRAAHERNQRNYAKAVELADQAIGLRARSTPPSAAAKDETGLIRISGVSAGVAASRLTQAQRNTLADVQALQIKATSLEAAGDRAGARTALAQAVALLDRPLLTEGDSQTATIRLAAVSPWLSTRVRADALRVEGAVRQDALVQLQSAVAAFGQKYPGSMPLAGFQIELARAEAAAGQTELALADYEAAFDIFRRQRGSLEASADQVATYFDILLRRIGDGSAQGKEAAQFFAAAQSLIGQSSAEAAKRQAARTMSGDTAAAGLARALDDTGRSIDAKRVEISALQQRGAYEGESKARVDAELQALVNQSQALEQQLLQADPRYASALRNLVGLEELQKALKPGEIYLKVFLLANRGYGMLVMPGGIKPYQIEMTREKGEAMVDALRRPIDKAPLTAEGGRVLGRYDVALAHEAFLALFGPVQAEILAAKHVIYEPDATLIGAPLGAFVTDAASTEAMNRNIAAARTSGRPLTYAGVAWLGAKVASTIAFSPSAFVQARAAPVSKATEPFYGFADPQITRDPRAFASVIAPTPLQRTAVIDYCSPVREGLYALHALPQTATEVKAVAASFRQDDSRYAIGPAFTDSAILRRGQPPAQGGDLGRFKVIYFATHGVSPQPGCLDAALVTSLGDGASEGLLDVKKIPQLNLDADLVVLSACDTGRGGGADAVGALVETFVQAGARNLLVSNWSVDTTATEQLMTAMFNARDVSQTEALAAAERRLMTSERYSHPAYWASFIIVGDGERAMPAL